MTALPHVSTLFRDYVSSLVETDVSAESALKLQPFYSPLYRGNDWMQHPPTMENAARQAITDLLRTQNSEFGAGPTTAANLDRLGEGAAAVVTGQQVGLFGGPLLTLMKAATAIHLADEASRSGQPHVPIFWLASEDHDFEEINQATFLSDDGLETLRLPHNPAPGNLVGNLRLGKEIVPLVGQLRRYLGESAIAEVLSSLYTPAATFASAFAGFLTRIFGDHGLIVIDAAARPFHALAHGTLRAAIEQADDIQDALLRRTQELDRAGYHSQVAVGGSSTMLFLIDENTGVRTALKKSSGGSWSAGARQYSSAELLGILDSAPERISPNVLLRPVMQDTLLPTSVYIGGPAEVAYFAQTQVVYQHILGRSTPILPRLSATLVDPRLTRILDQHQLSLTDVFTTSDALAQQLGARAMPVEGKRKLAATGNALDRELKTLTEWMHAQNQGLGHAGDVAASKMLYQMNRLRRLSAAYTLEREQNLRRHAEALCRQLFPGGNLQERVLAGAFFLARGNPALIDQLVDSAEPGPCAHRALPS
ncbi:MAG: bacillithiol biosynthesis cysteine-adding enzyme BshC [Acidobacteriaceae bacterium]